MGNDLKFVFITSAVTLKQGSELATQVNVSTAPKCERCWHLRPDVGANAEHPPLCGRCVSNLFGDGESREHA